MHSKLRLSCQRNGDSSKGGQSAEPDGIPAERALNSIRATDPTIDGPTGRLRRFSSPCKYPE
jgi:hypothetical protein